MKFEPRNVRFEEVVRESFSRQPLMATLGAHISRVAPGEVDIDLPYSPHVCQQNGYVHAGAIASVADSASGYAALTLAAPDTDVLAVEFKINLMSPAKAPLFRACGRVLRSGRTLTVCLAEVFGIEDGVQTAVATTLSTMIIRPDRTD